MRLTDTINLQVQHSKQVDQRLATMQSYMNQPRPSAPVSNAAQPPMNRGIPPQNHVNPTYSLSCYYCGGSHRIADCDNARIHLDLKWIKQFDRYLHLPDGAQIPRIPNKTMKDVVEELNKTPGIIPASKISDKASLFQDAASKSSYLQASNTESDDLRTLTELLNKVGLNLGLDQLQQLLNTKMGTSMEDFEAEEELFMQNFN